MGRAVCPNSPEHTLARYLPPTGKHCPECGSKLIPQGTMHLCKELGCFVDTFEYKYCIYCGEKAWAKNE